jgi:hypothetical protein
MSIVVNENDVTRLKTIKMEKGCAVGCAVAGDPKNPGIGGEGGPGDAPDPIPAQVVGGGTLGDESTDTKPRNRQDDPAAP